MRADQRAGRREDPGLVEVMTDDEWFAQLIRDGQAAIDRAPNNIPKEK